MHASGKTFDKICLKAVRDTFFSNIWSVIRGQSHSIFGGSDIQQLEKVQTFWLAEGPHKLPPLVGEHDLPSGKS